MLDSGKVGDHEAGVGHLWFTMPFVEGPGKLGPSGIRVICLRPDAIPEALTTSHVREVFSGFAERAGTTVEAMLAERARTGTLLKRFPTLAEVADFAAFVASDRASAMTGAIANLTCGSLVD